MSGSWGCSSCFNRYVRAWGGVGWGGMGWANNVHVGCRKDVMLRHATSFRCWSNFKWGGVGGWWGGLITFMSAAGRMWYYVTLRRSDVEVTSNGVGWGGMGWANNVHVGCRKDVMLRHATSFRCWSNFKWGGVGGGWGGLITFMSAAGWMWCYGMLRCEDVEVTSGTLWMLRCSKLCHSPTLMADGARAWSGAARAEERRRKIKITVSHVKHCHGQFTKRVAARLKRNRIGGTQVLDRIWDGLKSSLPRQLSTRQLTGDQFKLQLNKYVWVWQWKHHKIGLGLDLLQELGKLMKSINKKIGYWKWADRRCKKASNVFREYVFEIHFFQKSRFRYSENDTKLILRRASNVFEPFFNIDRARFMNKVLRFTGNCALNL